MPVEPGLDNKLGFSWYKFGPSLSVRDLVEAGTSKQVSEKRGVWIIVPGNPPIVPLDHLGYPVEIKRNEVRLLVDPDTEAVVQG